MDSETSARLTWALVILGIVFVLVLFLIISRGPSPTPLQAVPSKPVIVGGQPPLKNVGAYQNPPNTVPWSNVSPPLKRPQTSFFKTLPVPSAAATNTLYLNTNTFLNTDASTASQQPFQTCLVVPANWPSVQTLFQDQEAVNVSNAIANPASQLANGILPDLTPQGLLNQAMTDFDLTGPSQLAFGLQNQTGGSIFFVLNSKTNERFEVPAGKTAVFQSVSNFWTVMNFRQSNPNNLGLQSQLQWFGGILPLASGAYPLANVSTQEEARNVAAAEVEALYTARGTA